MHLSALPASGHPEAYAYQTIHALWVEDDSTAPRRTRRETEAITGEAMTGVDACASTSAAGVDSALLVYHCVAFALVVLAIGLRW